MNLKINGESRSFPEDHLTVAKLIVLLDLRGKYVAVERNGTIVSFRDFEKTALCEGDELEIVTLVGGG